MKRILLMALVLTAVVCGCAKKEEYHRVPLAEKPSLQLIRENPQPLQIQRDKPDETLIPLELQPAPLRLMPEEASECQLLSHLPGGWTEI